MGNMQNTECVELFKINCHLKTFCVHQVKLIIEDVVLETNVCVGPE